ncbi:MAG: hypothetical protein JWQ49_820 [Edaphobacter sp.]|nr:hypothetical protein [Edaphobacter sp.]
MTLSTLSQLSRLIDVDVFITFVRNLSSCRHSRSLDHLDEAESEIPALLAIAECVRAKAAWQSRPLAGRRIADAFTALKSLAFISQC